TSVRVIELAPPGVRTTLFGQESDEQAMPLEDFLNETLTLLHGEPTPKEIIVERAKFFRTAEATGNYENALSMLAAWKAPD
ncbi:oxidoreductase, partial [Dickeya undicola]